ncbi:translesion DNA synthesis-associated protein ImuA [Motiliproteus sp. MSK22-1]|uniref:translesion DNA synthesis-associated protein ImuA n=1 Tax=Motiliproteus sp. MSK22-1 TaxID=1897630 RepID=UPI0009775661|nr:translesion DNA synthesis-associated protein ImuA [Motiliproteus sp. MSK22-1]OMH32609.1 hypothetical protein BGP75_13735 [Motiliproteus sp. MSK22-1]
MQQSYAHRTHHGQLNNLLKQGRVWPARQNQATQNRNRQRHSPQYLSSGYPEIDQQLIGDGWQPGNLVELLYAKEGCGELRLLLPLLATLSLNEKWIIWVDPPHIPYAPALATAGIDINKILMVYSNTWQDRIWTLEQALKSGSCSAVLGWLPAKQEKAIRRLQIAASEGGTLGFLFRPLHCRDESSSAPYRLSLESRPDGIDITLIKRKNGWTMPTQRLKLGEEILLGKKAASLEYPEPTPAPISIQTSAPIQTSTSIQPKLKLVE